MATVTKLEMKLPVLPPRVRVAAYARVSMDTERMQHSMSAQVSYYSELIQNNPEWEYAGVYADYAVSGGGTEARAEFNRMLEDCEKGLIQVILTKSIQRFARNTVDLLQTVRHLRELGIEIRFEKEHLSTLTGDGELLLTLLASFAQEESRSISENAKWAIQKKYEKGIPRGSIIYGYRCHKGEYSVVPEEADIVRRIFQMYLDGDSCYVIANRLNAEGIKSYYGKGFTNTVILGMLRQEKYVGDVYGQKYFTKDSMTHKEQKNRGELPLYIMEEAIPAIVDRETFDAVQKEFSNRYGVEIIHGIAQTDPSMGIQKKEKKGKNRRKAYWSAEQRAAHAEMYKRRESGIPLCHELSRFMKCGVCGENMTASVNYYADGTTEIKWCPGNRCRKKHSEDRPICILDSALKKQLAEYLNLPEFSEGKMLELLEGITVKSDVATFRIKDGHTEEHQLHWVRRTYRRKDDENAGKESNGNTGNA